ncbi:MAG: hypothetical protein FWG80_02985 [Alphaproteobacteria bacterium]|nr:hypothetical protein [Alphaproteobacteria bacterium]
MRKNIAMLLMTVGFAIPTSWLVLNDAIAVSRAHPGGVSAARAPAMPTFPSNPNMGGNIIPPSGGITPPSGGGIVPPPPGNGGDDIPPDVTPPDLGLCEDGTSKNNPYSIDACMNDVLRCVNSGQLPNGLNDLYNADMRHSIMNGMGLCASQVDRCMGMTRKDCNVVYRSASDVWIDFNSRMIQPNYFSFVLRKTGLTPNQAENTCMLIDKNTYGKSFAAVSGNDNVTGEYNQTINAYNDQQSGGKNNPMGVDPNDDPAKNRGVDASRGHYARWDATTGECLVRVAAYNDGKLITNQWMFGAFGDDRAAEQWVPAGTTFSCNKSLFEFALRTTTKDVATLGIAGGAVIGAGIGAIAGRQRKEEFDIEDIGQLCNSDGFINAFNGVIEGTTINKSNCASEIAKLKNECKQTTWFQKIENGEIINLIAAFGKHTTCTNKDAVWCELESKISEFFQKTNATITDCPIVLAHLNDMQGILNDTNHSDKEKANQGTIDAALAAISARCALLSGECETRVQTVISSLAGKYVVQERDLSKVAWGAGIGATAGVLATAITAFIEKNQISCRVGDDLSRVAFNKSSKIDSLKDYYVKWALQLPETILPTAQVTDCTSWRNACGTLRDLVQCANAQIHYKENDGKVTLIEAACAPSGSVCIESRIAHTNFVCTDNQHMTPGSLPIPQVWQAGAHQ